MKLAVIAANGRTGMLFVERALAAGHSVRAGVHGTHRLTSHKNLVVVRCDATKQEDLETLITDQDAIVSFIGHTKNSPERVQTVAMKALIVAMHVQNMKRIVSLTGTGVRFDGDQISIVDRLLNMSIALIDPARVQDGIDHANELKKSDLDWTILRVLKLQNTKSTAFVLRLHGPTKWYVSRMEVADAMLQIVEQDSFIKQAPIIGRVNQ